MARIDDFFQAREIARKELAEKDIDSVAEFSGALLDDNGGGRSLCIRFLNREVSVSWPEMEILRRDSGEAVPLQEQVLILHYLNGVCDSGTDRNTGEWISFQDLPDGRFYMEAFIKRAKQPLIKAFGPDPKGLAEAGARIYNATPMGFGDCSVLVRVLPMAAVVLVLWQGDDEFPADGNILFDKGIADIMSAEDIAFLAGLVVYPLIKI